MEIIDQLEQRFLEMSKKIQGLEEEVLVLKGQLEEERNLKQAVNARIENLLNKLQEETV